jgi:transposase InsO family protein
VEEVWEQHGLAPALAALDLPRSTWNYHRHRKVAYEEKYGFLREPLEEIARAHPEYGYRRTTAELRATYGYEINHKVVQRLHQLWDLPVLRSTRRPRPSNLRQVITAVDGRMNLVANLEEIRIFQVAYTDFTELVYADGRRKAQLMPMIGHVCKMVYGWAVGERATTELALAAWEKAKDTLEEHIIPYRGMILHHDRDSVFTGYGWTAQLLLEDGVRLSYALRGAKDNPEMEGFNSRFKEENRSLLLSAQTLRELQAVVAERMNYYNAERRHSQTNYLAPLTFLENLRSCC